MKRNARLPLRRQFGVWDLILVIKSCFILTTGKTLGYEEKELDDLDT